MSIHPMLYLLIINCQVRAFNTETAEQFNSWLNGFETQLHHMTSSNYDFFIHVLFLLYAETVEARIEKAGGWL